MRTDSRSINNININYRFPIPRLDVLLDELSEVEWFSKIYLMSGYHQITMKEEDEWKTTFQDKVWAL